MRESRLDHAHKTALRLVRDNQAVYAEDLCVSGLARTNALAVPGEAGTQPEHGVSRAGGIPVVTAGRTSKQGYGKDEERGPNGPGKQPPRP